MPNGDKKNSETGGGNKWAVMGGITLNVEYTRKYGFDATAAAKITAKLVAVPPPTPFQEAVQADATGRGLRPIPPRVPPPVPGPKPPPQETPPKEEDNQEDSDDLDDDDERFSTLQFVVEDKPNTKYILDDGVMPLSRGVTLDDGTLAHRVSRRSSYCVITFEDEDSSRLEFPIVHDDSEVFAASEYEDDAPLTADDDFDEDEWPVLSLLIEDRPNSPYTLDDGVSEPSTGETSEEGLLVHPVSPDANACSIQFGEDYLIRFPLHIRG